MKTPKDAPLEKRLQRYDRWIAEGRIPFSSRVIPVRESLNTQQWVLPTEQVLEFLRNARSFALADCTCRTHYRHCDHPLETCFLINDAADAHLAQATARRVSLKEAESVVRQANERGLVHLTVYNPEQYVYNDGEEVIVEPWHEKDSFGETTALAMSDEQRLQGVEWQDGRMPSWDSDK